MPQSVQSLPEGYQQVYAMDLKTNKTMAIVLNIAAGGVVFLTFWLLTIFTQWARPELSSVFFNLSFGLADVLLVVLLVVGNMVVHELIHGLFFWVFTRARPVFGLSLSYAFAAAPGWYIPTSQYWIIGLAPLVMIAAAGLLVMAFAPLAWMLPAAIVVGFNTGGAVGDMWIIYKLLRTSPACLVNDTGHSIHFFLPKE